MSHSDAATMTNTFADTLASGADFEPLGPLAFHNGLPGAIRSLDNDELKTLLLALLTEWRSRAAK